jgi:hypothetical protein
MGEDLKEEEVKFSNVRGCILTRNLLRRKPGSLDALVRYFESRTTQLSRIAGRDYVGCLGFVRVCNDICGYEVKLGLSPGAELLDCCPAYYGLTDEQAELLYDAILSCVPGSCAYAEKQVRQGRMIGAA